MAFSYLQLFQHASARASQQIIRTYSTSFSWASFFLPPAIRRDIAHLYAFVRIADELVDGSAQQAGLDHDSIRQELSDLESRFYSALESGFDSNPIICAVACTFRNNHIPKEYMHSFFLSMHSDIEPPAHYSSADLENYIYGSAEVIGLMCLYIFHRGPYSISAVEKDAAQSLGRAFQMINFLRDYAQDLSLGRHYIHPLTPENKESLIAAIYSDLECARGGISFLPRLTRPAVLCAYSLFYGLTRKLEEKDSSRKRIRLNICEKIYALYSYGLKHRLSA